MNVAPAQADRLAKARAGIDQENAEKVIVFGTGLYGSEKPVFLVPFKESDAALALFLPLEFRQAMKVAHLKRLPQQLAQRGHLAVDGRIAVVTLAQGPDQAIQHLVREDAETLAGEDLVDLAKEGFHIALVFSLFPEKVNIAVCQLGNGESLYGAERISPRVEMELNMICRLAERLQLGMLRLALSLFHAYLPAYP